MSKDVYQNLMNIMNSIADIQKLQISALRTPLDRNINMNNYNINNANIINTGTLSSLSLYSNSLTTNTITTNSSNGLYINSTNYPSGTTSLLTITGQTTGNANYPNDIFRVNDNGSVIIGTYNTPYSATVPALTVYGSIDIEDGQINASNIINSINNTDGSIVLSGNYANKTLSVGTLSSLIATSGSVGSLYCNSGSIGNITVTNGIINNLSSQSGSIANLIVTNGTISNLSSQSGTLGSLTLINLPPGNSIKIIGINDTGQLNSQTPYVPNQHVDTTSDVIFNKLTLSNLSTGNSPNIIGINDSKQLIIQTPYVPNQHVDIGNDVTFGNITLTKINNSTYPPQNQNIFRSGYGFMAANKFYTFNDNILVESGINYIFPLASVYLIYMYDTNTLASLYLISTLNTVNSAEILSTKLFGNLDFNFGSAVSSYDSKVSVSVKTNQSIGIYYQITKII